MNLGVEFKAEVIRVLRGRGKATVQQLAEATGESLPRTAWCLKVLKGLGVVATEQQAMRGRPANWMLTGRPLPLEYTSRKMSHERPHYDHAVLEEAAKLMLVNGHLNAVQLAIVQRLLDENNSRVLSVIDCK